MWKPYLTVIAEHASQAVHVLDRFHVMTRFGKAIDEIRAEESRQLKRDGYEPVLKHSRWCLLQEEFQRFWGYVSARWAVRFLDGCCEHIGH